MADKSHLEMSDEEFLASQAPDFTAVDMSATSAAAATTEDAAGDQGQGDQGAGDDTNDSATGDQGADAAGSGDQGADTDPGTGGQGNEGEEGAGQEGDPAGSADGDSQAGADKGADSKAKPEGQEKDPKKDDKPAGDDKGAPAEGADAAKDAEGKDKAAETVDYKAFYEKLTTPFKANGKEIAVKSVDDAITLMQMGANYNKKMAALKPNLKLLKQLENNDLLNEEQIGFLIDLSKKKPEAISKLVKESGIDPLELDADKANSYKRGNYSVEDVEIELDQALDDISSTPTYNQTLNVIGQKWDANSKQIIAKHPQLIRVINDHIAHGHYALISAEVERERMLGRLQDLSDIEAYRHVGDAMYEAGKFNHLASNKPAQVQSNEPAKEIVHPAPKKGDEDKLNDKRRAASGSKPAAPAKSTPDFNPLAMSDEEFEKMSTPKFG